MKAATGRGCHRAPPDTWSSDQHGRDSMHTQCAHSSLHVTVQERKLTAEAYLRQDGDAEGSAGVLLPQVDGDLREVSPRRFGVRPARQLRPSPETIGEFWNLDKAWTGENNDESGGPGGPAPSSGHLTGSAGQTVFDWTAQRRRQPSGRGTVTAG